MSAVAKALPRNPRDVELDTYMRDVARHSVMTPTEERARAQRILELRIAYWRALLGYPPHVAAIVELLRTELREGAQALHAQLETIVKAASDLRGRRLKTDRKSTRLNSSHSQISYAVFCLKKKKVHHERHQPATVV